MVNFVTFAIFFMHSSVFSSLRASDSAVCEIFEARKATDFLEKSAAKLIEARRTKSESSTLVS